MADMDVGNWRTRLREAAERSNRSWRDISLKSGLSPGYLFSILDEKKDPTINRLMLLAQELDVSLSYVLYGVAMNADDQKLLQIFASLSDDQRSAFLNMADQMSRLDTPDKKR